MHGRRPGGRLAGSALARGKRRGPESGDEDPSNQLRSLDCAGDAVTASEPLLDPERPGPYPVGVTTDTFYDVARVDPYTDRAPRALKTEIWYPATPETRSLPRNRFSDFLDRGTNAALNELAAFAMGSDPAEVDRRFRNDAVRDARSEDGFFPLLVFSHGNGSFRAQSVFWCEHMASHGYVVAAPDHTYNAAATTIGGEILVEDTSERASNANVRARPDDVRFVIDVFARLARGDDSRFAGRVDLERVGVAGHSFGAVTAIAVADADPRVKAISPWASVGAPLRRSDVPVLQLLAAEDAALHADRVEACRAWFSTCTGPRTFVEFLDAGHYSFSEMFQFRPGAGDGVGAGTRITTGEPITYMSEELVHRYVNAFTLAFFDRWVKGVTGRDAYLRTNPRPHDMVVRTLGAEISARTG